MTKLHAFLAVVVLSSPASAFVPVPAAWARQPAIAAAASGGAAPSPAARRAKLQQVVMKKEPAARGGKAAKGAADDAGDPRRQALDGVLHQIERCYGRGSILKMGDTTSMEVETSSTGVSRLCGRLPSTALVSTERSARLDLCVGSRGRNMLMQPARW